MDNLPSSIALRESTWTYPFVESVHSVGHLPVRRADPALGPAPARASGLRRVPVSEVWTKLIPWMTLGALDHDEHRRRALLLEAALLLEQHLLPAEAGGAGCWRCSTPWPFTSASRRSWWTGTPRRHTPGAAKLAGRLVDGDVGDRHRLRPLHRLQLVRSALGSEGHRDVCRLSVARAHVAQRGDQRVAVGVCRRRSDPPGGAGRHRRRGAGRGPAPARPRVPAAARRRTWRESRSRGCSGAWRRCCSPASCSSSRWPRRSTTCTTTSG